MTFYKGNVILGHDRLLIVTKVRYNHIDAICFDTENASVSIPRVRKRWTTPCECYEGAEEECETCLGKREIPSESYAWEDFKVVGRTVSDYIKSSLMSSFPGLK